MPSPQQFDLTLGWLPAKLPLAIAKVGEADVTTFVVLPAETFLQKEKQPRSSYLPEYRSFLVGLAPGEGGELELEGDDKKATIKNRLHHAARVESMKLRFFRTGVNRVRFQVAEPSEQPMPVPQGQHEESPSKPARHRAKDRK